MAKKTYICNNAVLRNGKLTKAGGKLIAEESDVAHMVGEGKALSPAEPAESAAKEQKPTT